MVTISASSAAMAGRAAAPAKPARADTTAAFAAAGPPASAAHGSKCGELPPLQQFESFVLRSFVESMLPKNDTSFFGTGTAGDVWRSMLAERIGDEMAKNGGIGIAKLLAASSPEPAAASAAPERAAGDAFDAARLSAIGK